MKRTLVPLAVFGLAMTASAQSVRVYSEFARIASDGRVTAPERPREILSPAIARNAFSSFQVVVEAAPDKSWWLHVGQNPENAVSVTMYRLSGDRLEEAALPVRGQGPQVLWMDLWADRRAPTGRIKVEPQLNIEEDWVIYPMEVRVSDPVVPPISWQAGGVAPAPQDVMRALLCGDGAAAAPAPRAGATPSLADLRYRNALQDRALAGQVPKDELQQRFGPCDGPPPANPESYYAIRDFLFRHTLH